MFNSPETLLALAEVAISLAGFSAIVVVLKRGVTGTWSAYDAVRFHGMLVHSAFAILFCFLPSVTNIVVQDPVTSLHISSGVLGVQIIVHCIAVMGMSTSGVSAKVTLGMAEGSHGSPPSQASTQRSASASLSQEPPVLCPSSVAPSQSLSMPSQSSLLKP